MPHLSARSLGLVLALHVGLLAPLPAAAESWQVSLTRQQERGLAEALAARTPNAFAVSPDGPWGWAYGYGSLEAATARALGNCRQHLRAGRRDCIVYAQNGRVVAPAVVETRRVQAVYAPVNGRTAPSVFGLADVSFQGNRAAAEAQLAALQADPSLRGRLRSDPALRRALTGRSLVSDQRNGFAIWFDGTGGEQHSKANSGILEMGFREWVATPEGLVCMFDSAWIGTGKPAGTRCLILASINRGAVRFAWDGSANALRNANLVAGDARLGAVR